MFYDTDRNDHGLPHDPFLSCVVPRPIGWITTLDRAGGVNLAPFSFFNAVGHCPPKVMFSAIGAHGDGGPKDTLRNAEATGEFVVSIATWDLREEMNLCSAHVGRDVDEAALARLTMEPSSRVKPPRVQASPIHLECRYLLTLRLPTTNLDSPNDVVFGTVVGVHIRDDVIRDGKIDIAKVRPIARLGYMDYAVIDRTFTLDRPRVGARPGFSTNMELYGQFDDGKSSGSRS